MSSGYLKGNMVAEPIDPTAHHALAMAAAAAAVGMASGQARGESPLGSMVHDDLEISDDSFTKTPSPMKKSLKRDTRIRPSSRKRGVIPPGRPARSASAGAGGLRGMARPPSPAIEVAPKELAHQLMAPTGASGEDRLDALERQQKHDHIHFQTLERALQGMFTVLDHHSQKLKDGQQAREEHAQMGFNLRKEIYSVRDKLETELRDAGGVITTQLPAIIEQAATGLTARIAASEALLAQLQTSNAKHAEYLNELHAARPREGQAVAEGFQQVSQEVGRVKDIISQIENKTTAQNIFSPDNVTLTKEMMEALGDMYIKVNGMAQLYNSYTAMYMKVEQNTVLAEALSTSCAEFVKRLDALDEHVLNDAPQDSGGSAQWRAGTCGTSLNTGAPVWNPGGAPCCPPGMPGSSGDGGENARLNAITGGNGRCHCVHVQELIGKVAVQQGKIQLLENGDPWQRGAAPPAASPGAPNPSGHGSNGPGASASPGGAGASKRSLPLHLPGPLGGIEHKDRNLFDDKLTLQDKYRFNGLKGGVAWKGKVERYFISKAPVLKDILEWAEKENLDVVTVEMFKQAVGIKMTEEQVLMVNASIWGFLSGALEGTAETMFKRAESLNGLDAWRRMARYIDHGRAIRLETLRREVKTLHLNPIKNLESVEEGIANFENTIHEYEQAGGTPFQDLELKSDLLAILPSDLRENLLWQATDDDPDKGTFPRFRDMVLTQAAKILMNRRRLPIHAVDIGEISTMEGLIAAFSRLNRNDDDDESDIGEISTVEGLIAAFNRLNRNGRAGGGGGGVKGTIKQAPRAGDPPRRPRRCANCGKEHAALKCPEPPVAVSDRKCWVCEKKGHIGRDCPDKKRPIKAIEDAPRPFFGCIMDEGFTPAKRTVRPTPRPATIADFMSKNTYNVLDEGGDSSTPITESREHGASRLMSQPKAKLRGRDAGGGKKRPAIQQGKQKPEVMTIEEIDRIIRKELEGAEKILGQEERQEANLILDEPEDDELIGATTEKVSISVAMDSGAVDNVIGPEELPCDAEIIDNSSGRHFVGANNTKIEKYGSCMTKLEQEHGEIDCNWQVADVARPLHSLSKVAGPEDGNGKQDILFNNRKGYVVPPGIVDEIMKRVKPVAEYNRKGGLYVAEMVMSSFPRQDQAR